MQNREVVPLIVAASRLRITYQQALRQVLIGDLRGERTPEGKWRVDADALEARLSGSVKRTAARA